MTYIELVNATLVRLRENEISALDQTKYASLVQAYVNDAKDIVEDAWDWSHNRSIVTVTTVASTATYALTGVGDSPEVLGTWDNTHKNPLPKRQELYYHHQNYSQTIPEGSPTSWTFAGPDTNGDAQINIYPTPDAEYDLKYWVYNVQAQLALATTEMYIPSKPVILLAVAMLAEEKGETGGSTSKRYFEMADKILSDAIARDASQSDREIDWRVT